MKSDVGRGRGPYGLLSYMLDQGKRATGKKLPQVISTSLSGRNVNEMAREMHAVFRLRPDVTRPLMHMSLALVPGEEIGIEVWQRLVGRYLTKMEFPEDTPNLSCLHFDTKSQHAHIAASRVSLSGALWLGKWEARKSIQVCQELEIEFGLRLTPGLHGDDDAEAKADRPARKSDSQSIINANRVKGQRRIDTAECARVLLECAARSSDLPTFTQAAMAVGIAVKPNRSEATSHISGLSVIPPGRKRFQGLGDATGKKLTWPRLLKIFDQNDQAADAARLAARGVVDAADRHATKRVAVRLDKQPVSVPHPARAVALAAIEAAKEATMNITDDKLDFQTPPPEPRHVDQRLDDVPMVTASSSRANTDKREALDRNDRERAAAEAEVEGELQSATKTQLKRLRDALVGELQAHDAEAIEQMLARFTRLVLRLLTLNQIVLPPTESERRVHVVRHSLNLVDAEIRRRADVEVRHPAVCQPPSVQRAQPAPEEFQLVRAHDPREPQRDRDDIARELDARRERNRK